MSSSNVTVQFANVQTGKNVDTQVPTDGSSHQVSQLIQAAGGQLEYVTEIQLLAGRENVTLVVKASGQEVASINGNADNVANITKAEAQNLTVQATKSA